MATRKPKPTHMSRATDRPIDRSKKSNRRCVNCAHWPDKKHAQGSRRYDEPAFRCDVPPGGKAIEYWHCCPCFRWNPDKSYIN